MISIILTFTAGIAFGVSFAYWWLGEDNDKTI